MPNHVQHVCVVMGSKSDIGAFKAAHVVDGNFCFNTIIPQPESVKGTESSTTSQLWFYALTGCFPNTGRFTPDSLRSFGCVPSNIKTACDLETWLMEKHPKDREKGERSIQALRETGHPTWYEWCNANWGTKWGAYQYREQAQSDNVLTFEFQTAWSFPKPVFEKLAAMYPGLTFDLKSFDEGRNFACVGQINGRNDFAEVKATDELYEAVYGEKYVREEEEEEDEPEQVPLQVVQQKALT